MYRRVRENNLNLRGLTEEIRERLIRFQIRVLQLPEAEVVWSENDFANGSESNTGHLNDRVEIQHINADDQLQAPDI